MKNKASNGKPQARAADEATEEGPGIVWLFVGLFYLPFVAAAVFLHQFWDDVFSGTDSGGAGRLVMSFAASIFCALVVRLWGSPFQRASVMFSVGLGLMFVVLFFANGFGGLL